MRFTFCILAFILAAQVSVSAQESGPASRGGADDDSNGFIIIGLVDGRNPPFDKYHEIPFWEECVRMDKFALALQQQPDMVGYIIARSRSGEDSEKSTERLEQARNYLLTAFAIESERIITINLCGDGRTVFELWIESPGKFWRNSPPSVKLEGKVKTPL